MWSRVLSLPRTLPFLLPIAAVYVHSNHLCVRAEHDDSTGTSIDALISDWKRLSYPLRAHSSEIAKFMNFLEMLPTHKKALIIGATPELRDAALLSGKNITCVDRDMKQMREWRTNMRLKYVDDSEEKLVECDWLKLRTHDELSSTKYDLILFDQAMNRLPVAHWDAFLDQLYELLSDDGYIVLKVMCKPPTNYFKNVSVDDIINDWVKSDRYARDYEYLCVYLLLYLYEFYDENRTDLQWKQVIECVRNAMENNNNNFTLKWSSEQQQKFFELYGFLEKMNLQFHCQTEEELRTAIVSKRFFFQDVAYGRDDFDKFKFTPIYVLGKENCQIGGDPEALSSGPQELSFANRSDTYGMAL